MRHGLANKKLNRTSEHRKALLKNMLNSLIKYEQIKTTLPKAKFLKPQADKIITLGKKETLQTTKMLVSKLQDIKSANKVKKTLSKRYENRKGGYTRIIKAGFRYGDNAPMAIIEFVDRDVEAKRVDKKKRIDENSNIVEIGRRTQKAALTIISEDSNVYHNEMIQQGEGDSLVMPLSLSQNVQRTTMVYEGKDDYDSDDDSHDAADHVVVTAIYAARETAVPGVTGAVLVQAMQHPDAYYAPTFDDAVDHIFANIQAPAVVVIMSAGDAPQIGIDLLARLESASQ